MRVFVSLSRARSFGSYAPNPIVFQDIDAWTRLMNIPLRPIDVSIISAMDQAFLDAGCRNRDARQSEGVKTLPEGRGDGGTSQASQTVSQAGTPNPRFGGAGPGTQDNARRRGEIRGKPDLGASDQADGRCLGLRALTFPCALN